MDRLTVKSVVSYGHYILKMSCGGGCDGFCGNCEIQKAFDRLAAYEDTGLTPEDVAQLQALCDMRSEQHAKLMVENERLKKLLDQIAFIAGKGG